MDVINIKTGKHEAIDPLRPISARHSYIWKCHYCGFVNKSYDKPMIFDMTMEGLRIATTLCFSCKQINSTASEAKLQKESDEQKVKEFFK